MEVNLFSHCRTAMYSICSPPMEVNLIDMLCFNHDKYHSFKFYLRNGKLVTEKNPLQTVIPIPCKMFITDPELWYNYSYSLHYMNIWEKEYNPNKRWIHNLDFMNPHSDGIIRKHSGHTIEMVYLKALLMVHLSTVYM